MKFLEWRSFCRWWEKQQSRHPSENSAHSLMRPLCVLGILSRATPILFQLNVIVFVVSVSAGEPSAALLASNVNEIFRWPWFVSFSDRDHFEALCRSFLKPPIWVGIHCAKERDTCPICCYLDTEAKWKKEGLVSLIQTRRVTLSNTSACTRPHSTKCAQGTIRLDSPFPFTDNEWEWITRKTFGLISGWLGVLEKWGWVFFDREQSRAGAQFLLRPFGPWTFWMLFAGRNSE